LSFDGRKSVSKGGEGQQDGRDGLEASVAGSYGDPHEDAKTVAFAAKRGW